MKYNKKSGGYTIVEVLIVASISAIIGVSAFTLVSNKQEQNEYTQALRDFEVKLIDIANDVASGNFPRDPNYPKCVAPGNAALAFDPDPANTVQAGASATCVFGGKVIEFNPGSETNKLLLHTLAVRKFVRNSELNQTVTSLSQLGPSDLAIAQKNTNSPPDYVTENVNYLYGLEVLKVTHDAREAKALAFLSSFSRPRSNNPTQLVGAPTTNINWFEASGSSIAAIAENPNNYFDLSYVTSSGIQEPIIICVAQGGANGRKALVSLGAEGRQLSATIETDPPGVGSGEPRGVLCN